MTSVPSSWLWLYGPSGAGKTAVGYELFTQLVAAGHRMGYIEIDQLGMCLPADDAGRARVKVANLMSALQNFRDADVDGLVVSGDIAGPPMDEVLRHIDSQPVLCRLCASPATTQARLHGRGAPEEYAEAARTYDDQFSFKADFSIDTDTLAADRVADEVRRRIGVWPRNRSRQSSARGNEGMEFERTPAGPPRVVVVCGPTAVGKSAVAWEVFMGSVSAGVGTAFLDLAQIGFLRPPFDVDPHNLNLKARNVGAFSRNFGSEGARRLILSGEIEGQDDIDAFRVALAEARITVCALTAGVDELTRRALMRGDGLAVQLPGDELKGRSKHHLQSVAVAAAQRASVLGRSTVSDLHLNTDGLTIAEVSRTISSYAFPEDSGASRT